MLKQISLYAENKKGTLEHITAILLEHDINILGSMTDDGAEYGVNRMVVSSPDVAMSALTQAGYLCSLKDVIGVEITDEVGQLHKLLQAIEYSCINVDYLYLSFDRETAKPVIIFHTEDVPEMESSLEYQGYQVR